MNTHMAVKKIGKYSWRSEKIVEATKICYWYVELFSKQIGHSLWLNNKCFKRKTKEIKIKENKQKFGELKKMSWILWMRLSWKSEKKKWKCAIKKVERELTS